MIERPLLNFHSNVRWQTLSVFAFLAAISLLDPLYYVDQASSLLEVLLSFVCRKKSGFEHRGREKERLLANFRNLKREEGLPVESKPYGNHRSSLALDKAVSP
jgi:hypothetical protein